jgi:hypothetical protein
VLIVSLKAAFTRWRAKTDLTSMTLSSTKIIARSSGMARTFAAAETLSACSVFHCQR